MTSPGSPVISIAPGVSIPAVDQRLGSRVKFLLCEPGITANHIRGSSFSLQRRTLLQPRHVEPEYLPLESAENGSVLQHDER